MNLVTTSDDVRIITSSAADLDVTASYNDQTTTTFEEKRQLSVIAAAATTQIVGSPAASTQRRVIEISVFNVHASLSNSIQVVVYDGAVAYTVWAGVLQPGESVIYDGKSWTKYTEAGLPIAVTSEQTAVGLSYEFLKIGTASEAVAVKYSFLKDSGLPGAWVPGAPGVNGWWTNASTANNAANPAGATQTGAPQLLAPTNSWWLTRIGLATSVIHAVQLLDLLWYNTGLAVTTTTAQNITMPGASIPARDTNGTTNGDGWMAGIYVTTATTNAGAVTNTTMSYTNSDGVAGRTATIASFPATAVAGTFVPFQLQAGDRGIRSIQSVTLGTSYGGGAISLLLYRQLAFIPNTVVNVGAGSDDLKRNTRIYNGTSFFWTYISSATTATNFQAGIELEDR